MPAEARGAETEALQALTAGHRLAALGHYERALRAVPDTATKGRLRDAYLKVGWVEPRPMSLREQRKAAGHIMEERIRLWGKAADRFAKQGWRSAAIMMRRVIIEVVGEKSDKAKQERNRIKGLIRQLTERASKEQKAEAKAIVDKAKSGREVLDAAKKMLVAGRYKVCVRLCQEMMFGPYSGEEKSEAQALRKAAETKAARDVSTSEREAVRKEIDDRRFDRLVIALSRHFILIGPRTFVESIPDKEKTLLDLAYIYQSDLAAQWLTANGVRVVIYYQQTFDFGGGLGGGKLIRIGNRAIRKPIAGMLHYHELGHCIFGKGWLHHGFTEGLADFAAGFTLDALAQTNAAQHFITTARTAFVRFYLGRAVRYFDIQQYKPSAGFLFSFLPPGEAPFDWSPYRRAFRRMRDQQMGQWPSRDNQIMRYFGYLMAAEYGPGVFDTLKEWGWPVERRDFALVPPEAEDLLGEAKQGDFKLSRGDAAGAEAHYETVLRGQPDGPLAPRAMFGLMHVAKRRGDTERVAELKARLGILERFKVVGAFHARGQMQYAVMPPETADRIDHQKQVVFRNEPAPWKPAKVRFDGYVDLKKQGWGYPENAASFALAYVHSDAHVAARIWLASDDGHAVWVNGRLGEKRAVSRRFRFDDDFADVALRPGWNRILIKVHNKNGEWGFLARLTDRHGRAFAFRQTADDMESSLAEAKQPVSKRTTVIAEQFRSLSKSKWQTAVGRFDTQNGRLRPQGTAKLGLWQRFVVDPDKPKDGPANIVWLKSVELAQTDDFELDITVAASGKNKLPAKFGVTIDGENENDGQSGHTLVFSPDGDKLRCHWYRYDQLFFLQLGVKIEPAPVFRLTIRRIGSKWHVTMNGVPLFANVDAARLPAAGIGLLTWGKSPHFESLKLTRLN